MKQIPLKSAFTAAQRAKEIGIRKVLGASAGSIVILLSKDYGKLILVAFVIAAPIGWYVVKLVAAKLYVYALSILI